MNNLERVLIKPQVYSLILCLLFLVGCEQQHVEYDEDGNHYVEKYNSESDLTELVKYSSTGKVLARGFLRDGKKHGEIINYHDNGQPRSIANYADGMLEGPYRIFFPSGQLKEETQYTEDMPIGWSYRYWENGKKRRAVEYQYIIGISRWNQFIRYDNAGIAIKDSSHHMSITSSRDTIRLGEAISFHFNLDLPFYGNESEMRVLIGGFDDKFRLVDSTRTDTVAGKGLVAEYTIKPVKKGKQFIRGRLDDFRTVQLTDGEYDYMEEEVSIHFKKEFYVK